jgi:hypothetical protein
MPTRLPVRLLLGGCCACRPPQQFVHQRGDFAAAALSGAVSRAKPAATLSAKNDALMHFRAQRGQRLFGQRLPPRAPMMVVLTRRLMTKAARSAAEHLRLADQRHHLELAHRS